MSSTATVLAPKAASGISLNARLAALHTSRVETWKPADLQVNINQRKTLVENFAPGAGVQPGDVLEGFSLPEVDGGQMTLDSLVANGPAVLVFFRFAGCPACNIALPYYQEALAPALEAAGVPFTAISPQPVERLAAIKSRHALSFPILSDTGSEFARKLGLLYPFDDASRAAAQAKGTSIRDLNGSDIWELPKPAVIVIDPGSIVRFVDTSPDWLVRTEAPEILRALHLEV